MLQPGDEALAAPEQSPFDVLGVRPEDTDRQMKDARGKAAFAPDRHPGDDEAARLYAAVRDAYNALKTSAELEELWRRASVPVAALNIIAGAARAIKALRDEPLPLFYRTAERRPPEVAVEIFEQPVDLVAKRVERTPCLRKGCLGFGLYG
jgi:hypothetical protein